MFIDISTTTALILTVFSAVMWGSWMLVVKFKKDYPITGIAFLLYSFSLLLIGTVTWIAVRGGVVDNFFKYSSDHARTIMKIIFSGMLMSCGMYFNLEVISSAGLLLSSAISTSLANVMGVFTTLTTEGAPDNPWALTLYILVTLMFIAGGIICNLASGSHDRDIGKPAEKKTITLKVLFYAVLSAILINGWAMGTATGTADNVPPIITCFYMALGSFISIAVLCGVAFTKRGQWKQVLCLGDYPKKPLLFGLIAAFCHYGGNLISLYCMPKLSATLSFLLGRVYGVVTILWGLAFREFANSSRKTIILLATGVLLNLLALLLLGYYSIHM